jgi:hypothetical protein
VLSRVGNLSEFYTLAYTASAHVRVCVTNRIISHPLNLEKEENQTRAQRNVNTGD